MCLTAVGLLAQQTTTATQVKNFEVLAVDGNTLDVRLPEGTREITVPDDFRFTVNGQQMSVHQLQVGMKGTATITTRTTVTPVSVTEVKNGTVVQASGGTIIVRTDEGVKMFNQGDVDKRGVKIMRAGKPAQVSDFRTGDKLSAVIVTSQPPHVMTEREVAATTAPAAAAARPAPAPAAAAPPAPRAPAPVAQQAEAAPAPRTLPKTASSWPLFGLTSALLLAMGLALTLRRRLSH
jgi:hypothetical protein